MLRVHSIGSAFGDWSAGFLKLMEGFAAKYPHDTIPERYERAFNGLFMGGDSALADWYLLRPRFVTAKVSADEAGKFQNTDDA